MILFALVFILVVLAVALLVLAVAVALGALVGWSFTLLIRPLPLWAKIPLLVIAAAAVAWLWTLGLEHVDLWRPVAAGVSFLSTVITGSVCLAVTAKRRREPGLAAGNGVSPSRLW
ncbi:hypothetical protein ACWEPM_12075 [Streptomyces sp. NPDC004244]